MRTREELTQDLIDTAVDCWSLGDLVGYAKDKLEEYYNSLDENEFIEQCNLFYIISEEEVDELKTKLYAKSRHYMEHMRRCLINTT